MLTKLASCDEEILSSHKLQQSPSQPDALTQPPAKKAFSLTSIKTESLKVLKTPRVNEINVKKPKSDNKVRFKTQVDFSSMVGCAPVIITDQDYKSRKQTFDTFLKLRDLEMMLGGKSGQHKAEVIDRHSSLKSVQILHSKMQRELKIKLKQKKGKMYTNELWSMDYYTNIINSSSLKRKLDHVSSVRLKPTELKAQELEDICKKKIEKTIHDKESSLLSSNYLKTSQTPREERRFSMTPQLQTNSDPLPVLQPSSGQALKSILADIVPKKNPLQQSNLLTSESTDRAHFSERSTAIKSQEVQLQLYHQRYLQTSLEKGLKIEIPGNYSEGGTGHNSPMFTSKMSSPKSTKGELSKFVISKLPVHSDAQIKSARLEEATNFQKSPRKYLLKNLGFLKNEYPSSPQPKTSTRVMETDETYRKVQNLIDQCVDLNNENKDFERQMLNQKSNLDALTKKKTCKKAHLVKVQEISEALNRKAKLLKTLNLQKQGVIS